MASTQKTSKATTQAKAATKAATKAKKAAATATPAVALEAKEIPLSLLYLSPDNVRKTPHSPSTITALASSIAAFGLLSDLLVSECEDGRYAVEAGGGRLAGLQLLAERGAIAADYLVPCKLVPKGYAKQFSLTENIAREEMHPADMYVAFRDLAADGQTPDQIANAFGVSKLTVERRMMLGDLHPELLQMFRMGEIAQDQAIALARAGKPDDQLAVWESLPTWRRSAYHIRSTTDEQSLDAGSHYMKIIGGVEAYEAAGGAVERDLFAGDDDETEGIRILDKALVLRLVQEKLQSVGESVQAEGWAWVRVDFAREVELNTFGRLDEDEEATEQAAQADEVMQKLQAQADALEKLEQQLEKQEEEAEDAEDSEAASEANDKLRDVWREQRIVNTAISDRRVELLVFSESDKATAGCVVRPSSRGDVEVVRGLVERRPISADRTPNVQTLGSVPSIPKSAPAEGDEGSKRADYSAKLVEDFNTHISAALRNKIATNTKLALALACLQLMPCGRRTEMLHLNGSPRDARWYEERAVRFSESVADAEWKQIQQEVPDYETSEGHETYPSAATKLKWLLTLEQDQLLALFSSLVGSSIDVTRRGGEDAFLSDICDAANLDMRDYWNAGRNHFTEAVSRKVMVKALTESGLESVPDIASTPKAQAAAVAASCLSKTAWLPMPMRV